MTRPEPWQEQDAMGSYYEAIAEIGRRVKAGEIPIPTTGYFGRKERSEGMDEQDKKAREYWRSVAATASAPAPSQAQQQTQTEVLVVRGTPAQENRVKEDVRREGATLGM